MIYFTPRMLILLLLSMISGLPLALTASTMTAWLTDLNIDIKTIGVFALVGIAYAFKYAWAPLLDGLNPPLIAEKFGRRRGWMLICVGLMAALCFTLSLINPANYLLGFALISALFAFTSASYDINIDAFRIDSFAEKEQGAAAATTVLGYRLGMIVSTAGALKLASAYNWETTYQIMACVLAAGALPILLSLYLKDFSSEEKSPEETPAPRLPVGVWIKQYVIEPFRQFSTHQGWWLILLFIILFKLGDAFLGFMTNPFLLKVGYTKDQIAEYVKLYGIIATILGGFTGGWLVIKIGVFRSLLMGGVMQTLANLPYAYLATLTSPDEVKMGMTIAIDNFSGGLSTTAFVAYISGLCNKRFTATQYALLNSLASVGKNVVTAYSGVMVEILSWPLFFVTTTVMGIPGILLVFVLQRLQRNENKTT